MLSWRGSKDHPDMRIHILSLAWNISGAIDAHSHQHFVIAKLHMADVLRLVVVAYWEPLGYLQYSSSCRKLIRLSYYSFVQLMKVSKEYFCSFLILGLLACLGLRMMEMYSQRYLNGFQHSYFNSSLYLLFGGNVLMDMQYWKWLTVVWLSTWLKLKTHNPFCQSPSVLSTKLFVLKE